MIERILYTADLHGNETQYEKVFLYAKNGNYNFLVFGGDLTPKDPARRTPKKQRQFLFDFLFLKIAALKKEIDIEVLLILGNDDYISNYDAVKKAQKTYGFHLIDDSPFQSKTGYIFAGYTYVPYSPFKDKDWERRDLSSHKSIKDRPDDVRTDGLIAVADKLVPIDISDEMLNHSIEEDLEGKMTSFDQRKLIMVSHAPPYKTVCDYTCLKRSLSFYQKLVSKILPQKYFRHVGSQAVRKYIETYQPLLTLHGHIHDTVDLTGAYQGSLGKTVVATAGNDNLPENPYVLDIELNDEISIKRFKL